MVVVDRGVGPGTGELREHGPDYRLGLGTLSKHDFVHCAYSIIIIILNITGINIPNKRQKLSEWLKNNIHP